MRAHILAVVLGVGFIGAEVRADEPVVARLLEANQASVRGVNGAERPAEVYGGVSDGEKLILAENGSVVLGWHETGQLQRVSGKGEATVRQRSIEAGSGVQAQPISPANQELVASGIKALRDLPAGQNVTRSVKDRPVRPSIQPIFGSMVLSVEPRFSWQGDNEATEYSVRLETAEGKLWETAPEKPKQTELRYPSPKPLERGLTYQWVVMGKKGNQGSKKVAEGEFTVAVETDAREATELQKLAAAEDEFMLSLVALRLEQQDLIAESMAVYEKLTKLSAKTAQYHAALSELYDRAGRHQDAAQARERATKLGYKFK